VHAVRRVRDWLSSRRYYYRQLLTAEGEWELRILRRWVDRARVAVDVGANNGVYAFHLSRFARAVVAFEPNPRFHPKLMGLPRKVRLETVALSATGGSAELSIPRQGETEAAGWATLEASVHEVARTLPVQTRRLDDYGLTDVGFIKVDVEGHELAVLAGAEATVRENRPVLLVECEDAHRPGATAELFAWTRARGYRGVFFEKGRERPIEDFSLARHQRPHGFSPGEKFARQELDYVNNFLFVPG
jgi:FkbM family methyltransferase